MLTRRRTEERISDKRLNTETRRHGRGTEQTLCLRASVSPCLSFVSRTVAACGLLALLLVAAMGFEQTAQRIRKSSVPANTTQATGALKVITGQVGSVVFIN